jgi:hypothetical protein
MRPAAGRGGALLEAALFVPLMFLLLMGMVELARITYTYFTLEKMLFNLARYVGTQQGVNFCDEADPVVTAAKTYALTGTTDPAAELLLPSLTAEMIQIRIERLDALTGELQQCGCAIPGCDAAAGGLAPDFITISIPEGYPVTPRIPFLMGNAIPLKPHVRLPYGGT